MSTRRDRQVTPGHQVLFDEIRGLFRHVPFTDMDFAILAPNLAQTLSPRAIDRALPVFWDILDEQERDNKLESLITLLGFSHRSGNVLDRKNELNNAVHPRTHARWADAAIWRLLEYIDARFEIRFAEVHIRYAQPVAGGGAWVAIELRWLGNMDDPIIEIDGVRSEVGLNPDRRVQSVYDETLSVLPELTIRWDGTLQPVFNLWGRSTEPIQFDSYPHGCIASWG